MHSEHIACAQLVKRSLTYSLRTLTSSLGTDSIEVTANVVLKVVFKGLIVGFDEARDSLCFP